MKPANKYGTMRVMSRWIDLLPQILKVWRVLTGYAVALTLLSAVLSRWSYTCLEISNGFWCHWFSNSDALLFGSTALWNIVAFYLFCLFACDFYANMLNRRSFKFNDIFSVSKQRLKSVGIFFACLVGFIIPCMILIYILNPMKFPMWHTANPDWRIELIYFTVAFICMAIPLTMMRCGGGIAYFFNEGHIPFRKVYNFTFSRAYVGIFSFLLLALLCINFQLGIIRYLTRISVDHELLVTAVFTEFCNNFMILFYISLFLLLFQAEYLVLKEKEEDLLAQTADMPQTTTETQEPEVEAEQTSKKTKKSAKKKKSQRKTKQIHSKKGE